MVKDDFLVVVVIFTVGFTVFTCKAATIGPFAVVFVVTFGFIVVLVVTFAVVFTVVADFLVVCAFPSDNLK